MSAHGFPLEDLGALKFLVGRWRGSGLFRGQPVVLESVVRVADGGQLQMAVTTRRGEQTIYREEVEFFTPGEHVKAITRRGEGQEQVWDVHEKPDGSSFVLIHGHESGMRLRWIMRRIGVNGLEELYERAVAGEDEFETLVTTRYGRIETSWS